MNRKQKIIVSIIGIFIVLLGLLGITYGYFLARIKGNTNLTSFEITTADLRLVYEDDSNEVIGAGEYLFPSNKVYTKTFTVRNEGDTKIKYGVYLINIINTFERKDDIKYTLSCSTDGDLACNEVSNETTFPSFTSELSVSTIEPGVTHTYTFSFTYKETYTNQSVDMGKELQAKIQIYAENNEGNIIPFEYKTLAYNILSSAKAGKNGTTFSLEPLSQVGAEVSKQRVSGSDGTLIFTHSLSSDAMYTYASDYTLGSNGKATLVEPKTALYSEGYMDMMHKYIVSVNGSTGAETSSNIDRIYKVTGVVTSGAFQYSVVRNFVSNEKILSVEEDDYGTSYFYRGGVTDNYVTFANMCWRIVRVLGDGSTKLILEDSSEPCSTRMDGNWNLDRGSFGFNLIGSRYYFNYLNPDQTNSMSKIIKDFQTNKLSGYLTSLKQQDLCFDDRAYLKTSTDTSNIYNYSLITDNEKNSIISNKGEYYYNSHTRLIGNSVDGYQPTLKCGGTIYDEFSDGTPMYAGVLTADEAVYAGAKVGTNSHTPYLFNDYQSVNNTTYWTISPEKYTNTHDYAYLINEEGRLLPTYISNTRGFRPTVIINSNVKVASGQGTLDKPYVIK